MLPHCLFLERDQTLLLFLARSTKKNTHKGIAPERYVECMQCTLISASPTPCKGSESLLLHRCSGFWLQYCSMALFLLPKTTRKLIGGDLLWSRLVWVCSRFPSLLSLPLSPFSSLHASYAVCLHATFAWKLRTDSLLKRAREHARNKDRHKKISFTIRLHRFYI